MCNYLVGKNADVRWRWPTRTRRWTWKASWWQNRRRRKGQKDDDGFYLHVLRPKGKICKCVLFIRGKTSKYCVHEDLSATQPTDTIPHSVWPYISARSHEDQNWKVMFRRSSANTTMTNVFCHTPITPTRHRMILNSFVRRCMPM